MLYSHSKSYYIFTHTAISCSTVLTSLTAFSETLEATASISVWELNTAEVQDVVRFMMAFSGRGVLEVRQVSLSYTFTTPVLELQTDDHDMSEQCWSLGKTRMIIYQYKPVHYQMSETLPEQQCSLG